MTEETIFAAALEQADPAARSAYLEEACAGDDALRRRVEGLLAAHAKAGDFLEQPASAPATESTVRMEGSVTPLPASASRPDGLPPLQPSTYPDSLGRLGHYEILGEVGRGAFGIVLKAHDTVLQRVVAIKVPAAELSTSGAARQRFLEEARRGASIRHEHVVAIHAVEETPVPFLVMDFIDGPTLQDKIRKDGPLPPAEVLRIGTQIAEGLAASHRQGLIHRDIKPANILLENGIQAVRITDFGLARAYDDASQSRSGVLAGTPEYMSPEQAEGLPLDPRSDLFSLGSTLYAACTGHAPFRAKGALAVLRRVTDDTPRPIREINSDIPPFIEAVVSRLMAKKPEDRYSSAREVADLLAGALATVQMHGLACLAGAPSLKAAAMPATQGVEKPIRAPSRSPFPRMREFVRRHWVGLSAVLLPAILLPLGLVAISRNSLPGSGGQGPALPNDRLQRRAQLTRQAKELEDTGKPAEAEKPLRELVQLERGVFGPESPEALQTVARLMQSLLETPAHDEVMQLSREYKEGMRRIHGRDHPLARQAANDCNWNLCGLAFTLCGGPGEESSDPGRARQIAEEVYGEDPIALGPWILAWVQYRQQDPHAAVATIDRRLAEKIPTGIVINDTLMYALYHHAAGNLPVAQDWFTLSRDFIVKDRSSYPHYSMLKRQVAQVFGVPEPWTPGYETPEHCLQAYDRLIARHPNLDTLPLRRAVCRGRLGRWKDAAGDYAAAIAFARQAPGAGRLDPRNPNAQLLDVYSHYAILCTHLGETDRYNDTCKSLLEQCGGSDTPGVAERVVEVCSINPRGDLDREQILQLARRPAHSFNEEWALETATLALYRAGKYQEAVATAQPTGLFRRKVLCLLFQAMAHKQLGHQDQARDLLKNSQAMITAQLPGPAGPELGSEDWADRPILYLLVQSALQEAKELIEHDGKPPPATE